MLQTAIAADRKRRVLARSVSRTPERTEPGPLLGQLQAARRAGLEYSRFSSRQTAGSALLHGLCCVSSLLPGTPRIEDGYITRIFGGLLAGKLIAMPLLERPAFALGRYEPRVVRTMLRHVRLGDTAYDIGAHIGYLTLVLSKLVGRGGAVFAFEPDPRNRRFLAANVNWNRLGTVRIIPAAVSNTSGSVTFASFASWSTVSHIVHENTPADAQLTTVPAITLDEYVFEQNHPPPAFIKIDVEGREDMVLQGAERLLREVRPTLLVEVQPRVTWQPVVRRMASYGYRWHALEGRERMRQPWGATDVLFLPG